MSINTTVDSVTYSVPETGERGWGTEVTNLLVALGNNSLLIKGGSIPLTSDADFGAAFGLTSIYYKSRSANIASTGVLRLANTDLVGWRNGANDGDLSLTVASDRLQFESSDVVLTDSTDTLSNKTIDSAVLTTQVTGDALETDLAVSALSTKLATAASIKTYVDNAIDGNNEASEISYDNSTSGLTATNVQDAIDEVEGRVDTAESNITTNAGNISTNTTNISTNAGNISANTADVADIRTTQGTSDGDTNLGTFTGTTISDNTTVKNALQELETEVELKADSADLTAHTGAASGVHGVTGNVVGTSDSQVLTNKDIDGGTASNTSRLTVPQADSATLAGLTRKEGTVAYDTDLNTLVVDDGTSLVSIGGGGLVPTAIDHTDLPLTAESGKYYLVDMSGATADETLTWPNISTQEESIGVQIVSASDTYDLIVAADASDTIDGSSQFNLRNERDWRVGNAQSASNWSLQRPSSGSGAVITEWQNYTPTSSNGFGTISSNLRWRRVGNNIEVLGDFTTGTVDGTTANLELPNSYTIDTGIGNKIALGRLYWDAVDNANRHVVVGTNNTSFVEFAATLDNTLTNPLLQVAANSIVGSGARLAIHFSVPVVEFKNNGTTVTLQDLTAKTKRVDESVCSVSNSNGGTVQFASFVCSRDSEDNYNLDYQIHITGAASSTSHTITLGLGSATFSSVIAGSQGQDSSGGTVKTNSGAATIAYDTTAAGTVVTLSGSAQLSGKPSWFDSNTENSQTIDAQVKVLRVKYNLTDTAYTAGNDIDYDTVSSTLNTVGTWSNTNGVVTAPKSATYRVSARVSLGTAADNQATFNLHVNGTLTAELDRANDSTSTYAYGGSTLVDLVAGDTISIRMSSSETLNATTSQNWLQIEEVL